MGRIHLFLSFGIFLIGLIGAFLVGISGWSADLTTGLNPGEKNTWMFAGYLVLAVWLYSLRRFRKEYLEQEKPVLEPPQKTTTKKKRRK